MASLYEKLKKRRKAMSSGDPTGGKSVETKRTKENKQKTRPSASSAGSANSESDGNGGVPNSESEK